MSRAWAASLVVAIVVLIGGAVLIGRGVRAEARRAWVEQLNDNTSDGLHFTAEGDMLMVQGCDAAADLPETFIARARQEGFSQAVCWRAKH